MNITGNIENIKKNIPEGIKLVAVSKTRPEEDILSAYNAGHKIFGENRVQELTRKYQNLPKDIEWHMIGHLQSNKVKHIASFVYLIHGVDSLDLLIEINKQAAKYNRVQKCLLQVQIAKEETKFGFSKEEIMEILRSGASNHLNHVELCGLMGMATYTDQGEQIRKEFHFLKSFFDELKQKYFKNNPNFMEVSMGMSDDYQIAIEEGSSIIRVGTSIFGLRNYNTDNKN